MAFLNQITKFSKDDLTPVQTVVTKHDGSKVSVDTFSSAVFGLCEKFIPKVFC